MTRRPFDAVLVVAFGGPEGMGDVRPFLANVLRGRRVAPERVEAVAQHYEHFGGVSPLAAITRRQVEGLRTHLAARGPEVSFDSVIAAQAALNTCSGSGGATLVTYESRAVPLLAYPGAEHLELGDNLFPKYADGTLPGLPW